MSKNAEESTGKHTYNTTSLTSGNYVDDVAAIIIQQPLHQQHHKQQRGQQRAEELRQQHLKHEQLEVDIRFQELNPDQQQVGLLLLTESRHIQCCEQLRNTEEFYERRLKLDQPWPLVEGHIPVRTAFDLLSTVSGLLVLSFAVSVIAGGARANPSITGIPCVYEGHLRTEKNWFGYLANLSIMTTGRMTFEFSYAADRCCQNILFYSEDQMSIISARMNCWQKEYLLRPEEVGIMGGASENRITLTL